MSQQFFVLFEAMLDKAALFMVGKGQKKREHTDVLWGTSFQKRKSQWPLGQAIGHSRSMSEREFQEYLAVLKSLTIHKSHWGDLGYTQPTLIFSDEEVKALENRFVKMRHDKPPQGAGGLNRGQALLRIAKINDARANPFPTTAGGRFRSLEEIIAFLNEEMGSRRAAGQHARAVGVGKALLTGVLATGNPWGLNESERFQVAAAVCALGHWTAQQAGPAYLRERRTYLRHGLEQYGNEPFFHYLSLVAETYDDPHSDAPYRRLKMMRNAVRTSVFTYPWLGGATLYQAAEYAMRHGTHPDDCSNQNLFGESPSALLRRAIDRNVSENGSIEDAVTETQALAEGYAAFKKVDAAEKALEEARKLISGSEAKLQFRHLRLCKTEVKVRGVIYEFTKRSGDLDSLHNASQTLAIAEIKNRIRKAFS